MARPAIRALRRPLIEQYGSSFSKNAGHIWQVPQRKCIDQLIASKCWTTTSWRELHSASQVYGNEAGPSNSQKFATHHNKSHRSKTDTQVVNLRREANHPNTRPIVAAELLREVLEAEQVWPLSAHGFQPAEAVDLLNFLRDRQMKEGRWQHLNFLQHIEFIHDGIRNCYHRVRQNAKSKIIRESRSSQLLFTEEDAESEIAKQADVKMWQSLLKLRALRELLSSCRQVPLRIPSVTDIRDILEANENDPRVPDRRSKYEKLLQDINRTLPPYKRLESPAATQLLDETKMEELAIDWNSIHVERAGLQREKKMTFSDIKKAYKDLELSKPLGSIRIFEDVWKVMQIDMAPTSSCYSAALAIEIKLATWRSAKLRKRSQVDQDELDQEGQDALELVWKPVTDLLGDIHARKELKTKIINQVMWSTVRHDPNHSFPNFDQYDQNMESSSAKFVWPTLNSVSAVYEILRNILLQRERGLAAPQSKSHQQRKKHDKLPANLLGDLLLDDDHIPTEWTYNLMLRFHSSRGDMRSVLQIVQDMDNTTIGTGNEYPKISMVTFGYIFDAFAKNGVPSRMVHIDRGTPEESRWTADENVGYYDKHDWNMDNLNLFYERFLQKQPAEQSQTSPKVDLYDTEKRTTHPATMLDRATTLIQEQMANHTDTIALAPSSQQQFYIITALRRVSGDEPEWVISQFVRLAAKFSATFSENAWDANGSPINHEGWTRFRITSRIERIMEMMYELRDSEDDERKEMKWQTKFHEEIKARLIASQDEIG